MYNHSLLANSDSIRFNNCPPSSPINSTNTLSTIDVHLLPPASISNASTIVEKIRGGDRYIKEVIIEVRKNKKYLIINSDTQKKGSKKINMMEGVNVSASAVRRLLIEALHLIEQLHQAGYKLKFPLQ